MFLELQVRAGKAEDNTEGWATGYWKKLCGQLLHMQHSSGRAGLVGWLATVETLCFFVFLLKHAQPLQSVSSPTHLGAYWGTFCFALKRKASEGCLGSSSHTVDEALYPSNPSSIYMMNISSSNQWSPSKTPWSNLKCVCVQTQVSSKLSSEPPQKQMANWTALDEEK